MKGCDFLSDFNIQVGATLEQGASSKLQQDLKNMKNLSIEIQSAKLADSAVSGIKSQLESALKGIKIDVGKSINLGNSGTGISKAASQDIQKLKEVDKIYSGLQNKIKQMGSLQLKLNLLDSNKNQNEIREIERQLQEISASFSESLSKSFQTIENDPFLSQTVTFEKLINLADQYDSILSDIQKKTAVQAAKNLDTSVLSANNILQKLNVGDYQVQLSSIEASFKKWGYSIDEVKNKFPQLYSSFNELKTAAKTFSDSGDTAPLISALKSYETEIDTVKNNLKEMSYIDITQNQRISLSNKIEKWLQNNTRATKEARQELQRYLAQLKNADTINPSDYNNWLKKYSEIDNLMRAQGKLGRSFSDAFKNAVSKFSEWGLASGAVMSLVNNIRSSITELKNVDTLLTEISKANDKLSSADLKQIGSEAFDIASNYGKKASDYLSGVQDASRAGYENAKAIAELSTAVQGAGDMTADLANQYIISTDKAYQFNGSIEKLTEVLDGSNYITNNYATTMTDLAEGMSIVGSTAASFGVDVDEATAALATMSATTQQSGSEVARAFRAILLNIRQVSDEEEGIDAEGLTKYEEACNALGVSLKETKNGILSLRDPMEVLKELSVTYNQLSETDIRRTNLLSSVGGKLRSTQLDALLRNWSTYEQMLQTYSEGTGSMAREAEKTANSWEGSMNRLSNTWTDTVGNIANSDVIIGTINTLNALLSVVNSLTESLGGIGSIGLGIGLFAGIKNIGRGRMYPLD